jgi:hypothetical protein
VHELDLLELVLADHAACVLAIRAGLRPEARRMRGVPARQRVCLEDLLAREVRHRNLGGRDQEQLLLAGDHAE